MRWLSTWILCLSIAGFAYAEPGADRSPAEPAQPRQPEAGPGGSDYRHPRVRVRKYEEGAEAYWLFEPAGVDKAQPLPVVLFVHGMNLPHHGVYRQWITHLVRQGHLVVYPRYQAGSITDPKAFTKRTAKAMRQALERMDGNGHCKADINRFAMVGHSLGGTIALNLAARPEHYGLPAPKAVMPILPGDVEAKRGLGVFFPKVSEDYSTIADGTLLLVIASTNDAVVGRDFAEHVYQSTTQIKLGDKDLLLMRDDRHGKPALSADHFMPLAYGNRSGGRGADAYDHALWRWFDALTSTAFGDPAQRGVALGGTDKQLTIGQWSDGQAIKAQRFKPDAK